jgi:hypothetical protein
MALTLGPEKPERGYWQRDDYYGEMEWIPIAPTRWYHYVVGAVVGIIALTIWFFLIWMLVFGAQPLADRLP